MCLEALTHSIAEIGDCEVIVMDNGSTDKTRGVLERYRNNELVKVIYREKNYGLNAFKKLFREAQGEYIVSVDDDVVQFPDDVDLIFGEYMKTFPDFGYVALNVVQNEFTNGAKPGPERYTEETRNGKTIQVGPTGAWCSCFRKSDFQKVRLGFRIIPLSMKRSQDGILIWMFKRKLHLKSGIIKDAVCFHMNGPYYAKQYGHLDHEIEKYSKAGLQSFVKEFKKFNDEKDINI
jgi:glycosyltransferase involved in cell wall biosynthesis